MNIAIGSDHRGVDVKTRISSLLESLGHTVTDCGTHSSESCDYPDIAYAVAAKVAGGGVARGILICGSGIGMSMTANKTPQVRAALCHDVHAAEMSRRHNDANVLCLSADHFGQMAASECDQIISTWIKTEFEGGRHQRRVDKITSGLSTATGCHE